MATCTAVLGFGSYTGVSSLPIVAATDVGATVAGSATCCTESKVRFPTYPCVDAGTVFPTTLPTADPSSLC